MSSRMRRRRRVASVVMSCTALVELSGDEIEAGGALTEALGGSYRNDDLRPALVEIPTAKAG